MGFNINILELGLVSFKTAWDLQLTLRENLINGTEKESIIICSHYPVITAGTSAKNDSLLVPMSQLKKNGIEFYKIERGGDLTYHSPEQLIVYPIIDLRQRKKDVSFYMRTLENIIVEILSFWKINGIVKKGYTGVWTEIKPYDELKRQLNQSIFNDNLPFGSDLSHNLSKGETIEHEITGRKIASLGVKISHWCTMHGFALNVLKITKGFDLIHPCGFKHITITSMEEELELNNSRLNISLPLVREKTVKVLLKYFNY